MVLAYPTVVAEQMQATATMRRMPIVILEKRIVGVDLLLDM